jgi:hypothetical protein
MAVWANTSRRLPTNLLQDCQSWHVDSAKVIEPAEMITVNDDGGLSDSDEMNGPEWLAAINAPPKGKKRLTSEVSLPSIVTLYSNDLYPRSSTSSELSKDPAQGRLKSVDERNFQIMSHRNGSGIHLSRRISPLSVKPRTLVMFQSTWQST